MLTKEDYCDYDTAWELCSLGYPEEDWCLLYSAQKWLREEKKEIIIITSPVYNIVTENHRWSYEIYREDNLESEATNYFDSYEEALLESIRTAVKILKEE